MDVFLLDACIPSLFYSLHYHSRWARLLPTLGARFDIVGGITLPVLPSLLRVKGSFTYEPVSGVGSPLRLLPCVVTAQAADLGYSRQKKRVRRCVSVVSLQATARQAKESLAYCVVEPAASDPAASAVLSAEREFCAAHPEALEEISDGFSTTGRRRPNGGDRRSSLFLSRDFKSDDEGARGHSPTSTRESFPLSKPAAHTGCSPSPLPFSPSDTAPGQAPRKAQRLLRESRVMAAELFFDETFLQEYRRRVSLSLDIDFSGPHKEVGFGAAKVASVLIAEFAGFLPCHFGFDLRCSG